MDLATLLGILGGFVIIAMAVLLGGSPVIFINIPSILIVVLGSLFIVSVRFTFQKMINAFKVAGVAFAFKLDSPDEIIVEVVRLARIVRKDGPLGLEKVEIKNKFLARGVRLVVDNTDPEVTMKIMEQDRVSNFERHEAGQNIFMGLNDVAPAMGMIGTLIGLVQMLANMSDPSAIGPAMAVALLTTLYGAIISNMIAKPIAEKLVLRAMEEDFLNAICIDAIYGMAKGLSPMVIEENLMSYLSEKRREDLNKKKEEMEQQKAAKAA